MTKMTLLAATVALVAACAPSASADTWTIAGSVANQTGASGPCPNQAPAGYEGCVYIPSVVWDDASLRNGTQQGGPPAPYVDAGSSNPFLFFAEGFDAGADMYASAVGPDGANWTLTVEDDVGSGGNYAGCAETNGEAQAPSYVCTPRFSGSKDSPVTSLAFSPSANAPTLAAGQWCQYTFTDPNQYVDCATGATGVIAPLNIVSGEIPANFTLTNTGSTPVTVGVGSRYDASCNMGAPYYPDTCTVAYDDDSGAGLFLRPITGNPVGEVRVEVTAVAYGTAPVSPPTSLPNVGVVDGALRPGDVLRAGQVAKVGPYRLTMRADGNLVQYATDGRVSYQVFASGTAVPGSRLAATRDGHVVVRDPGGRTLWSSRPARGARAAGSLRRASDSAGNLVLWSPAGRRLWSHGRVTGPLHSVARGGFATLAPGRGLASGGQLAAGRQRLTMRTDGELVLTTAGRRRWSSRTAGNPGAYLLVRADGNVVVSSLHGRALWSSRTVGHRGARLRLGARHGRITLTTRNGRTVWKAVSR